MPTELLWHALIEIPILAFGAGGGWWMLQQLRKDNAELKRSMAEMKKEQDRARDRNETRFRTTLVALTVIASHMSDNPGGKESVMDAIRKMSDEND